MATPPELIARWRSEADAIDSGRVAGSHLRAITIRLCANQLECAEDSQATVIDGTPEENEAALIQMPIGAVVYTPQVDGEDPIAWVHIVSRIDGKRYWRGTGVPVSKPARYLAQYCAPLEVR